MATPSPIDLTTVAAVKASNEGKTHDDDDKIQFLITAFSRNVHTRTGVPITTDSEGKLQSSLTSIVPFCDIYDGTGSPRLFLRNRPIQSLIQVQDGQQSVRISQGFGMEGLFIDASGKSIAWRTGDVNGGLIVGMSGSYYTFSKGYGNIQVTYTAGYEYVPEDLGDVVTRVVAQNYARNSTLDLKSKSQSGGTTSYRDWEMPPDCEHVILNYRRVAVWT